MTTFKQLDLPNKILDVLVELGYEEPTPVQAQSIPVLLSGSDLSAQAQTGTGKTAAFSLPILAQVNLKKVEPQALIITPTRELAIQVAEALQSYAKYMKGFHVAPIYGGQDYKKQLKALDRGLHVVVGTPGRVMDHMRRGSLNLDSIKTLVLDEADEMLRMGFVEDVEWILDQIPQEHQTALFSATMPKAIMKIAKCYLKNPEKITIKPQKNTVDAITQYFMRVTNKQKLEALTRYLEVAEITAVIIFVRTKNISTELAERLQARGYAAAALNGDMNQSAREKVISRLKNGKLDIVVATDVAARGIDVDRISHVINYDMPHDTESYIHRIGRTGRAGRQGEALLFVSPREQRLLKDIEKAVQKEITQMSPPTIDEISERRGMQLIEDVLQAMVSHQGLEDAYAIVDSIVEQSECSEHDVAALLIHLLQQQNPLPRHELVEANIEDEAPRRRGRSRSSRGSGGSSSRNRSNKSGSRKAKPASRKNDGPAKKSKPKVKKDKPAAKGRKSDTKKSNTRPKKAKTSSRKSPALKKSKKTTKKPRKK